MDKVHMNWLWLASAPVFLPHSLISTAAHDSQYSAANSTVRSKSLVHPTVKEPLPLHCRDTFTLCQHQIKFRLMFQHLQPHHCFHSFLIPCIQELPVPQQEQLLHFAQSPWTGLNRSFSRYTCLCQRRLTVSKYSSSTFGNFIPRFSPNPFGTFLPFSNLRHRTQE
jgi:hypothetical protein